LANKAIEFVIRGKVDWCKLLGKARPYTGDPKYDKGPNWSVEINPDAKSRALLEQHGLESKLKTDKKKKKDGTATKNPRDYSFLRLTVLENKADGTKNDPPVIIDASGAPWNSETEIGNGSVADVLVRYIDYGTTQGLYYRKMRVLSHVPYEGGGSDFEPLSEDDEFFGAPLSADKPSEVVEGDEDTDDDVPF
jgi:hypothetical protein